MDDVLPDYEDTSEEDPVPLADSGKKDIIVALSKTQKRNQRKKLLKLKMSEKADKPSPYVIPATINPLLNVDTYLDVECIGEKFSTGATSFSVATSVPFHADPRLSRVTLVLPKKDGTVSPLPPSVAATATYYGGSCSTCRIGSKAHSINDRPRLFLIGDEMCPLLVGDDTMCCPVLRVHSGDFGQCFELLHMQFYAGLRPKPGAVLAVLLSTHLRRVGFHDYWREFVDFRERVISTIGFSHVMLCLPPFPPGYGLDERSALYQAYRRMEAARYASSLGGKPRTYDLLAAFDATFKKHGLGAEHVASQPIRVSELGNQRISCNGPFALGFGGDWTSGIPPEVELSFLTEITDIVLKFAMRTAIEHFVIPPVNVLEAGQRMTPSPDRPNAGRTLYIMGSSLADRVRVDLAGLAEQHRLNHEVVADARGFREQIRSLDVRSLQQSANNDVLVLCFIGNAMLNKEGKWETITTPHGEKVWHLIKPTLLSDADAVELVSHLSEALAYLKKHFNGKILLCGPFPRHLKACCTEPTHTIVDANGVPFNMLDYTKILSKFLKLYLVLPDNCEFVDFRCVFKGELPLPFLCDGVHLSEASNLKFAEFLVSTMSRPYSTAVQPADAPGSLSDMLRRANVISKPPSFQPVLPEERAPIDQAIQLHNGVPADEDDDP